MARHDKGVFQVPGAIAATLKQTALHVACDWPLTCGSRFRQSRSEKILALLSMGAHKSIGLVDRNGQTAIHLAVMSHIPNEILLSLLGNKAAIPALHITDRLRRTALHYACMPKPHLGKSQTHHPSPSPWHADRRAYSLISRGASVDIGVHVRQTPIYVATVCASAITLKLLLTELVIPAIHDADIMGRTALHYACDPVSGSIDKVNILLNHGASEDVDVPDYKMQTPLHLAAMMDDSRVLARLLDSSDTTINSMDSRGRTPLHCACMRWIPGSQKISLLVRNYETDASIDVPDGPTGRTPIHLATISGAPAKDLEFLLLLDFSVVHITDDIGRTPLYYACHA
jgi:ankyrin repeat protein